MENPRHELYTSDTTPGPGYLEIYAECWRKSTKVGVVPINFNNNGYPEITRAAMTGTTITRYDGGAEIFWNDNNFYIINFTVTHDILATGCITIGFRITDDSTYSVANRFRGANCWNFNDSAMTGNIKCETIDDIKPQSAPNDKYDGFMISGFDYVPANTNIKIKALF